MKKKLIFIALLTVMLTLSFISCSEEEEAVQKKIVVTGIPSDNNYNYGVIGLGVEDDLVAMHLPEPISNGSFTGELLQVTDDGLSNKSFTGVGNFMVVIIIYKKTPYNSSNIVYKGGINSITITNETTTIPFSSFTKISSSVNVSDTVFNLIN